MTPTGTEVRIASPPIAALAPASGTRAKHGAPARSGATANGTASQQRQVAASVGGATDTLLADLTDDLACPICMSVLRDPFVTSCGHSFCHACVSKHLVHRNNCPSCAAYLTVDGIFPNFLLQKVRRRPLACRLPHSAYCKLPLHCGTKCASAHRWQAWHDPSALHFCP